MGPRVRIRREMMLKARSIVWRKRAADWMLLFRWASSLEMSLVVSSFLDPLGLASEDEVAEHKLAKRLRELSSMGFRTIRAMKPP